MSSQSPDEKMAILRYYASRGWPLYPCKSGGKRPINHHGFRSASTDERQIESWMQTWPDANWGIAMGKASGLLAIDVDVKNAGVEHWIAVCKEHEPIKTLVAHTPSGGLHIIFKYPKDGDRIKSRTGVLGGGIDIRGEGSGILVYPSEIQRPYAFEVPLDEIEIADIPEWLLTLLTQEPEPARPDADSAARSMDEVDLAMKKIQAISYLNALKPERCSDHDMWLDVGFSLQELGKDGLVLWDDWSKRCPEKYQPDACAESWATFKEKPNNITFASLVYWANGDQCAPVVRPAKKAATPDYAKMLGALGFRFALNEMNDSVYVNGVLMTDVLRGQIDFHMRSWGYKSSKDADASVMELASLHPVHPIRDYLKGLSWDGQDHIQALTQYFRDKDGVFALLFRKWLIGSVRRILGRPGQFHPVLVLDGPQNLGKSFFVRWLGSPLPEFYLESPIITADKDFKIRACSNFVWEVQELDTTIRRQDRGSLKAFLSDETVTVRKPYGRADIRKPYTASFIGTVNNMGGFLDDPTGNRRYRICTLTSIDWKYSAVDVNQIWAQAVALFQQGETAELDKQEVTRISEVNSRYELDDPLAYHLVQMFNIDPADGWHFMATAQIIERLRLLDKVGHGENDKALSMRISHILTRLGCQGGLSRIGGNRVRGWFGICYREPAYQQSALGTNADTDGW